MHISVSRTRIRDDFLREAFGCKKCFVRVPKLTSDDIARIRENLVRLQKSIDPASIQAQVDCQKSTINQHRKDENVFKPPVPYPSNEVEVQSINHECEKIENI